MDFTKIDIEATAKPKVSVAKFTPKDKDGTPLVKIAGEPLVLDIVPMSAPEGAREFQKWRLKYGETTPEAHMDASEDDLDALADAENARGAELAARVVAGWNIVNKDGKPVPCTLENRKAAFENEAFAAVAVAVMAEVTRIATELGNSKTP